MKKYLIIILLLTTSSYVFSQELIVRVQVVAPQIQNMDKRGTDMLQGLIRDFLNNTKWSNETYLPQERLNCNFVITITSWDGNSTYKAEAQIQSNRPIYNTGYSSTILNFNDKDFDFNYTEGQPLDFSEQSYISNLSSLLSFYAYTIIGLDKDSFSKLSGTPYYTKALNTINMAQTSGFKGWKGVDGLKNRYWLNQNLLDNSFTALRLFVYDYHLKGLDQLQANNQRGSKLILDMLPSLQKVDKQKLGAIFPNIYLSGKADEITNILLMGDKPDRIKAYNLLSEIDPANINKYEALLK